MRFFKYLYHVIGWASNPLNYTDHQCDAYVGKSYARIFCTKVKCHSGKHTFEKGVL